MSAAAVVQVDARTATEHELAAHMLMIDRERKRVVHELAQASALPVLERPAGIRDLYDLAIALGGRHDQLEEIFRRRFYPRAHRVVAVSGTVMTVSRTGRSIVMVFEDGKPCDCGAHESDC